MVVDRRKNVEYKVSLFFKKIFALHLQNLVF
jgi:hypothetical protein